MGIHRCVPCHPCSATKLLLLSHITFPSIHSFTSSLSYVRLPPHSILSFFHRPHTDLSIDFIPDLFFFFFFRSYQSYTPCQSLLSLSASSLSYHFLFPSSFTFLLSRVLSVFVLHLFHYGPAVFFLSLSHSWLFLLSLFHSFFPSTSV